MQGDTETVLSLVRYHIKAEIIGNGVITLLYYLPFQIYGNYLCRAVSIVEDIWSVGSEDGITFRVLNGTCLPHPIQGGMQQAS